MLSDARPLFEGLPASYADPLALAAQQAPGTSSIIVVSYVTPAAEHSATSDHSTLGTRNATLPPSSYDLYACRGGQIVSVARTTPDFRFPIMPAVALDALSRRATAAREGMATARACRSTRSRTRSSAAGSKRSTSRPASKSTCVEARTPHLVAAQLEASACRSGVLEVNDFSDVLRPRIKLLQVDTVPRAGFLAAQLSMTRGRVLLYDRARNTAIARDRAGEALDMEAALCQADRLASARRPLAEKAAREAQRVFTRQAERVHAGEDEAHLAQYFTVTDAHPRLVAPSHASAQALGALLDAPAQGRALHGQAHDALALLLSSWDAAEERDANHRAGYACCPRASAIAQADGLPATGRRRATPA